MRYVSIIAGRKSNKGMYEYKKGSKKREENPAAKAIVERYKLAPKEKYDYLFTFKISYLNLITVLVLSLRNLVPKRVLC